ncbi:hypothetical protein CVT26_002083 [Gymnopilus dilepis]|uniref:Uncharacterized protein n=1 Tax=Gymnopilus dilepis TaxID=231916 RepID=A0A409VBL6_9AGAR|nr:hypothetical protein CVT26_002083 [Gymnopilus dilepis]
MTISAISPATVHVILDYVRPLTGPVPPHLLSRPLLQRHHFLSLSPDDPADYLAWPSPDRSHAVQLLQESSASPHDLPLLVHYLPDPQNFQAHVRITSELRLIFLWDKSHGWQYHNVALMPFPPNTYSSLDDALSAFSPDDFLPEQNPSYAVKEEDDDSYWDAYGQDDDSDRHRSSGLLDPNTSSEDAYWAQYSNIQGSGDSTLPSPLPTKKKLVGESELQSTRIIVPSDDLQTNHVELYNPLEPPPPESLARRLEELSSQNGTVSPLFEDDPQVDSNAAIPQPFENVPPLTSSPSTASPSQPSSHLSDLHSQADAAPITTEQHLLSNNIKSLYQLWALTRQDISAEQAKELFLARARQALEEL